MKKYLIVFVIIGVITGAGYVFTQTNTHKPNLTSMSGSVIPSPIQKNTDDSKEKLSFRSLVRKGDYFFAKNDQENALKYYLRTYRLIPGNITIEKKIADAYFDAKSFDKAYEFYKKASERDKKLEKKAVLALLFSEDQKLIAREYPTFSQEMKEYISYNVSCYKDPKNCAHIFGAYAGTSPSIINLKNAAVNAGSISQDIYFKQVSLMGALLKEGNLLTTGIVGEYVLHARPDYIPALKLSGIAYYELGKYEKAKVYLEKYYNSNTKDIQGAYLLGMTQYYLKDYISSNLYFNNAVVNGYEPKIDIERRLIYNYFLLDDKKSMFKVFRHLLGESKAGSDDYYIAIYSAITGGEISKAYLWTNKGLEKFPDNIHLLAFRGWIYRIQKDYDKARQDTEKVLISDPKNIIALFNKGALFFETKQYNQAKVEFQKIIDNEPSGYFSDESKKYLTEMISLSQSASGETLPSSTN